MYGELPSESRPNGSLSFPPTRPAPQEGQCRADCEVNPELRWNKQARKVPEASLAHTKDGCCNRRSGEPNVHV